MNLGSPAPDLVLRTDHGRALTSADVLGRPWVLAFIRAWSPGAAGAGAAELAAIRAELRGLGAELVIVADGGVWSFRPDDDLELWSVGADSQLAADVAAAAERYGVAPHQDAVHVIDALGAIRFAHVADGALPASLFDALAAAGRQLTTLRLGAVTFPRRDWIVSSLCVGFALALETGCRGNRSDEAPPPPQATAGDDARDIVLNVNGMDRKLRVDPRVSLLDALRERLGLTGMRRCEHGECGACTVIVDDRGLLGCMTPAAMTQDAKILTIEGNAAVLAPHRANSHVRAGCRS